MDPAFVSGVEPFVNKVVHSVVIHGHNVRIKDYSLTAIRRLTGRKWFLNHFGKKTVSEMTFRCPRSTITALSICVFTFFLLIFRCYPEQFTQGKQDSVVPSATFSV